MLNGRDANHNRSVFHLFYSFEGIKDIAEVLKPASTYVISPVIPLARSEHKKAATLPTSSVVTALPKGALSAYSLSMLLKFFTPDAASVFIGPAEMALTLIPFLPNDAARNLVFASRLAFARPITL